MKTLLLAVLLSLSCATVEVRPTISPEEQAYQDCLKECAKTVQPVPGLFLGVRCICEKP
jgi:hypothetical protein